MTQAGLEIVSPAALAIYMQYSYSHASDSRYYYGFSTIYDTFCTIPTKAFIHVKNLTKSVTAKSVDQETKTQHIPTNTQISVFVVKSMLECSYIPQSHF